MLIYKIEIKISIIIIKMTQVEYFTFDVTHKYISGKKTNSINYENGYYIGGSAKEYRRLSLKKINKDVEQLHTYNQHIPNNNFLNTDINNSYIIKRRKGLV